MASVNVERCATWGTSTGQVVNFLHAVAAASVVMGEIGEMVVQVVGGELLNR